MPTQRSGVTYSKELEWRLAAKWAGYTYEDFCKLDGERQSDHIAAYRSSNQIEAVLATEQAKRNKKQSGRQKPAAKRRKR